MWGLSWFSREVHGRQIWWIGDVLNALWNVWRRYGRLWQSLSYLSWATSRARWNVWDYSRQRRLELSNWCVRLRRSCGLFSSLIRTLKDVVNGRVWSWHAWQPIHPSRIRWRRRPIRKRWLGLCRAAGWWWVHWRGARDDIGRVLCSSLEVASCKWIEFKRECKCYLRNFSKVNRTRPFSVEYRRHNELA